MQNLGENYIKLQDLFRDKEWIEKLSLMDIFEILKSLVTIANKIKVKNEGDLVVFEPSSVYLHDQDFKKVKIISDSLLENVVLPDDHLAYGFGVREIINLGNVTFLRID